MAQVIIRVFNAKRIAKPGVPAADWFDLDVDQSTTPLKLDISAVEVGSLGDIYGIGSQQFTLPNTPVNNDFFNYAFNINAEEAGFTFQKTFTCQILVDGGVIASGKLYFDSVTTDNKGGHFYNCTFTDAVSSITDIYKDTLIADLDWNAYNHNFTVNNITGSWDEALFNGDIIYPNVLYGYPENVTTWAWDASYFGLWNGLTYTAASNIPLNAFKPSVRVKTIFDKVFDSINYEYESNFISNSTSSFGTGVTASFSDLYMLMTPDGNLGPLINTPVADGEWYDELKTQTVGYNGGTATANITFQSIFGSSGEVYDPNNMADFNSSNNITFPYGGTYRMEPGLIFRTNTAGYYTIELENITTGEITTLIQGNLAANTDYSHNQAIEFDTTSGLIATVYAYRINIKVSNVPSWSPGDPQLNIATQLKDVNIKIDNAAYDAGVVEIGPQFGDLKVVDFLKGLTEQFNLVWWADKENPRKIYIEPWNAYIKTGVELDWSNKVDYSVKWDISHPSADAEKTIIFANDEDEDSPNQYYIVNDNVPFGSYTYQAQSDYAEGEKEIGKSFFAPTIVKPIPGTNAVSSLSNMVIPHIYTDGYLPRPKVFKFKPRLLFKNGKKDYSFPYRVGGVQLTTYYQMTPSTNLQYDADKFDLNFSSYNWFWGADNVVTYNHYTDNDSFNVFWANYINNIYRNPARKVTLNIKFEPIDLFQFRVNDLIFIDGQTYLINKISGFNLLKPASTQVELIKVLYPSYNKPVFIVEGNDDIQVPGHGDPIDDNIGQEWVFEPDTGDPVRVVPTDIVNNDPISVDSIKKTLIRQQGFLPSSSIVWKEVRWNKQSVNTNIKNNLQYGVNTSGNQSANSINLGTKNEVNSETNNTIIAGNTNIVGLTNTNLNIIGNDNVIGRENNNLVYIGNNSNSGVNFFKNSIIMDIVSGSNTLNNDSVEKTGIFALNKGVILEGAHSGSVVIANVNSGSLITTIGKTGYSVDNSFFMGNDDSNMSPNSSSIENNFIANNTDVDLRFVTKSGVFTPSNITLFNNNGIVLSGSANSISAFGSDDATIWQSLNVMSINDTGLEVLDCADVTSMGATDVKMRSGVWILSANDYNVYLNEQNNIGSIANQYINVGTTGTEYFNNFYATNLYVDVYKSQESVYLNNRGVFNPGTGYGPQTLLTEDSNQSAFINNNRLYISQSTETELIGNKYMNVRSATDSTFINNNGNSVVDELSITITTLATSSRQSTFINNSIGSRFSNVTQSIIFNNHQINSSGSVIKTLIGNNVDTTVLGVSPFFIRGNHNLSTILGNTDIKVNRDTTNTLILNTEDCEFRASLDNSAIINDADSSYSGSSVSGLNVLGGLSNKVTGSSTSTLINNTLCTIRGGTGILLANNTFSTLADSSTTTYINNSSLNTSGSISATSFINNPSLTFSGSSVDKSFIGSSTNTITLSGTNNTILNNSGSSNYKGDYNSFLNNSLVGNSGSISNSTFVNNHRFSISSSTANRNTFINNSGSLDSVGSGNTIINLRGNNHEIGGNKTIIGYNGTNNQLSYSNYSLDENSYATFAGTPDISIYNNGPATSVVSESLFTGRQFHYGAQFHGYEFVVGASGSTNTLSAKSANTVLLDWFSTAGTSTLNLPLASDNDGRRIYFKANGNISATKVIRLATTGGERIDANLTYDINRAYQANTLMAMDGQWWLIAYN